MKQQGLHIVKLNGIYKLLILLVLLSIGSIVNAQQIDCIVAPLPRLIIGEQAQVTPGLPNNVRSGAGIYNNRIGQLPAGSVVEIIEGPVCAGNYYWWQVRYRGLVGWTAEGVLNDYWLEPVTYTSKPTLLSLRVDPVLQEVGGKIILEPETFTTIMLSSLPNNTNLIEFYFTSASDGQPILIGSDNIIDDGGQLVWWVEPYANGSLSAKVYNTDGDVLASTSGLNIAASIPDAVETHTHSTLGIQVDVLSGWNITQTPNSLILTQGTIQVDISIAPPSGLPAGDRITFTGFSNVTGIDLRRDNLVYQNRTKAAYYNYQGLDAIPMNGLPLYVIVSDTQSNYESINLSEDTLVRIDQMIATLQKP